MRDRCTTFATLDTSSGSHVSSSNAAALRSGRARRNSFQVDTVRSKAANCQLSSFHFSLYQGTSTDTSPRLGSTSEHRYHCQKRQKNREVSWSGKIVLRDRFILRLVGLMFVSGFQWMTIKARLSSWGRGVRGVWLLTPVFPTTMFLGVGTPALDPVHASPPPAHSPLARGSGFCILRGKPRHGHLHHLVPLE